MSDQPFQISFVDSPSIVVKPIRADLLTMVAPIAFRSVSTGETEGQGTAFSLMALGSGDALYVTARHVVEDIDGRADIEPLLMLPAGITDQPSSDKLVGLQVKQVAWIDSFCDVALIVVDLKSVTDVPFQGLITRFPLGIGEPVVGSKTVALGYPRLHFSAAGGFEREFRASLGTIEAVHNHQQDVSHSTYPTFQTDGLYLNGMSGGPVLDERGRVIGVVSDGLHGLLDELPPVGYAAQVGALMELSVDLRDDAGKPLEYSMVHLAQSGMLALEHQSPLHVDRRPDGVHLVWDATGA